MENDLISAFGAGRLFEYDSSWISISTFWGNEGAGSGLARIGGGIADVFINLSAEYPAILDALLFVFAGVGVILSATAAFDQPHLCTNGKSKL